MRNSFLDRDRKKLFNRNFLNENYCIKNHDKNIEQYQKKIENSSAYLTKSFKHVCIKKFHRFKC